VAAQTKRGLPGLGASVALTALLMGAAGYAALYIAPTERSMGQIQRIFYMHMPSGINAFMAFFIAFIANIFYLAKRSPKADRLAVSAAEVGLALITVMLVTGPIWAKPVWGVWWVWDARLTSTFVLWVMYVSYLLLRGLIDDPERKATVSAVYAMVSHAAPGAGSFWRTEFGPRSAHVASAAVLHDRICGADARDAAITI
jgi:ABC-type transport system involved in cytochrome c biogenesis permease subunit